MPATKLRVWSLLAAGWILALSLARGCFALGEKVEDYGNRHKGRDKSPFRLLPAQVEVKGGLVRALPGCTPLRVRGLSPEQVEQKVLVCRLGALP